MNAYVTKEEIRYLPANRISYAQHHADAHGSVRKPGVFARLRDWMHRQSVMSELHGLTDRELNDIGLARAEIGRVFDRRFATGR